MKLSRFSLMLAPLCIGMTVYAAAPAVPATVAPVTAVTAAAAVVPAAAAAPGRDRDLDLLINHYSKVVTPDGVTRESRYAERMLRRPGHVWTTRVLPAALATGKHAHHDEGGHRHGLNHVMLARHLTLDGATPRLAFVDVAQRTVIAIPRAEFENVNFDGSWERAYYLLEPRLLKSMKPSQRPSNVAGARWREQDDAGLFQRVLWDEARQIPLVLESGDKAGTFYRRVEVTPQAGLAKAPWQNLQGYAQREFADFLD